MRLKHYLYVHVLLANCIDERISEIVKHRFPDAEYCGGGAGGGVRDKEYTLPRAVTQEELDALQKAIAEDLECACEVNYDAWDADDEDPEGSIAWLSAGTLEEAA